MKIIFKVLFSSMLRKYFESKTDVTDAKSISVHIFLPAAWKVMWFLLNENEYWSRSIKAISFGFKSLSCSPSLDWLYKNYLKDHWHKMVFMQRNLLKIVIIDKERWVEGQSSRGLPVDHKQDLILVPLLVNKLGSFQN